MITLHQFRCYLATLEHGSFTAAADQLQLAQPSVSEQVRLLEQGVGTVLFQRVGRGLIPTEAAQALRPHAERALAAVDDAGRAVASVRELVTGTVRFGVFGTARVYLTADLVADVLSRYPGVRLELVGRNSQEVLTAVRRGTIEAALIALPIDDEGLQIAPIARDEVVYVSADPDRLHRPITARELASAQLVLSEASWGNADSTRQQLARAVQAVGGTLTPRIDVEDIEVALDLAARGLGDAITARGVLNRLGERLDPSLGWVSLRPKLWDEFAIVHRRGGQPSPAAQVVIDLAAARMRAVIAAARAQPGR
ncbi:MAG: LysR family transcriptional regulator [Jatrophihabitantaceae bacterium]